MIEQRSYRKLMGEGRFTSFTTGYKETDLWIGINPESYLPEMKAFCLDQIRSYRMELERYLFLDPQFGKTLLPWETLPSAPELARTMAAAATRAEVGPMAAVAGAFSEKLGHELMRNFAIRELAIENGGDIFLSLTEPLILSVIAGNDPLSGRVGIELPKNAGSIGVCTSAGKVGPSLSFGNADAVMVACRETALADAWATALGNRVHSADDIKDVMKFSEKFREILSLVIICEGKLGIRGDFDLKIIA